MKLSNLIFGTLVVMVAAKHKKPPQAPKDCKKIHEMIDECAAPARCFGIVDPNMCVRECSREFCAQNNNWGKQNCPGECNL